MEANTALLLRLLENSGPGQQVVSVGTVFCLDKFSMPKRQHSHILERRLRYREGDNSLRPCRFESWVAVFYPVATPRIMEGSDLDPLRDVSIPYLEPEQRGYHRRGSALSSYGKGSLVF